MTGVGDIRGLLAGARSPRAVPPDPEDLRDWEQTRFVLAPTRWNVVVCSRRAGKTFGAIRRAFRRLMERPNRRVLYVHHTRDLAAEQFWRPFLEYCSYRGCDPAETTERPMRAVMSNGSRLVIESCDDVRDVSRFRGDQWDEVIIDEVQEHDEDILVQLIDQAILPSLGDRAGSLSLMGTPPDAGAVGYLWDRWDGASDVATDEPGAWKRWHWSLTDNPHFPQAEIAAICAARKIGPGHPIYEREFRGLFVADQGLIVYEYQPGRNDRTDTSEHPLPDWRYVLGLDLGFQDADAISVLGWSPTDANRELHEVYGWAQNHQDVDQLAAHLKDIYRRFRPERCVGDTGGHGAVKVLKSLESRLDMVFEPKPPSVSDSVALMNDEFRTGRLKLIADGPTADDCKRVVWVVKGAKREIGKRFHSDRTEAARYAHHASDHFRSQAPPPVETDHRKIRDAALARRAQMKRNTNSQWR